MQTSENTPEQQEPAAGLDREARDRALEWVIGHGIEDLARCILGAALQGKTPEQAAVTTDIREFQQCLSMLDAVPEARAGIQLLRDVNLHWRRLAGGWDQVEQAVRDEGGTKRMPPFWEYQESPARNILQQTLLGREQ